jgi:hypothetical protein
VDLNQIIKLSIRIYAKNVHWFFLAGLLFFISTLTSFGMFCLFLIFDGVIALTMREDGTWLESIDALILISISTLIGIIISSYIFFASLGAFMHMCTKIGAQRRDISIISFLEYMQRLGISFWMIGLFQNISALVLAAPLITIAFMIGLKGGIFFWIALILAGFAWTIGQLPFWLAFPIEIIKKKGAFKSMRMALKNTVEKPIGSLILLIIIYILLIVPMIIPFIYPIYFFFVFAPFVSILTVTYYEAIKGMLK